MMYISQSASQWPAVLHLYSMTSFGFLGEKNKLNFFLRFKNMYNISFNKFLIIGNKLYLKYSLIRNYES